MEVQGTVLDWKNGVARVQIAAGACSSCEQDCPARAMARPSLIAARAPQPLEPGQHVQVDVSLPSAGRAVAMAFLLPLLGFVTALFAGNAWFEGAPLPTLGLALAGAGLAYAAVAIAERRHRSHAVLVIDPRTLEDATDPTLAKHCPTNPLTANQHSAASGLMAGKGRQTS